MRMEVVSFLLRGKEVLLSPKKIEFAGIWSGYGGKVESGESPEGCAVRELLEEAGVVAQESDMRKCAFIRIYEGMELAREIHVFLVHRWKGEPRESAEHGAPRWFPIEKLPFDEMFEGDSVWIPQVLAGCRYDVEVHFSSYRRTRLDWIKFSEPTF